MNVSFTNVETCLRKSRLNLPQSLYKLAQAPTTCYLQQRLSEILDSYQKTLASSCGKHNHPYFDNLAIRYLEYYRCCQHNWIVL